MKIKLNFNVLRLFVLTTLIIINHTHLFSQVVTKKIYNFGRIKTEKPISLEELDGFFTDSALKETIPNDSLIKKINNENHQSPLIRKDDVQFYETIWEDVDGREKKNRLLVYQQNKNYNTNDMFISVMLNALVNDTNVKAYNDDMFTSRKSLDEIETIFTGPLEHVKKPKSLDEPDILIDTIMPNEKKKVLPDSIYSFRFKYQYIYDSKISRMYYRIIGIAPLALIPGDSVRNALGNMESKNELVELFWVSYNKIRPYLKTIPIYNPKNSTDKIFWNKLLEHKYFDGRIVKTSYQNFKDQSLNDIYKNDTKKRLQMAEKTMQRIDDFEQDRWVY